MKAIALLQSDMIENNPLRLVDIRTPKPGPGELRIQVSVCGVCRTDLHIVEGDIPRQSGHIIPGHEVVGFVDALGTGCVRFAQGDRVGAAWLFSTCAACPYCLRHDENLCQRAVCSVTANTRADGRELLRLAAEIPLRSHTREFALEQANEALQMLKHDQIDGAAVLRIAA